MPTLDVTTEVDAPIDEVFRTSLDLDVEKVAGQRFHVRTVPGGGRRTEGVIGWGETVGWQVRLLGVIPLRHTSRIVALDAPHRFVDAMQSGMFASFRHTHTFADLGDGRTRMTDAMTWRSPLGVLGQVADVVFVRRVLSRLLVDRNAEVVRRVESPVGVTDS